MMNHLDLAHLLRLAKKGNPEATVEIFSYLRVRFSEIVTHEIRECSPLWNKISEQDGHRIAESAISEIQRLRPIEHPDWSILWANKILRNTIENFIANMLTSLAKTGDKSAEQWLFALLEKKLSFFINQIEWRNKPNASTNE